jgi:preprotein translocase subunit SecA
VFTEVVDQHVPPGSIDEQWDLPGLERLAEAEFGLQRRPQGPWPNGEEMTPRTSPHVREAGDRHFAEKEAQVGGEMMRQLEKHIMLNVLDQNWKEHLARMDYLRQGIHLRGYAQKQPKQEYKRESFELFTEMLDKVKREWSRCWRACASAARRRSPRLEAEERRRAEARPRACSSSTPTPAATAPTRRPPTVERAQALARSASRPCATCPRSAATIPAPAAAARSTSTATGSWVGSAVSGSSD